MPACITTRRAGAPMRSAPAPSAECAPPLACVHRRPAAAASPAGTLRPPRRTEELRSPPARRPRARLRGSIDPANRGKDGGCGSAGGWPENGCSPRRVPGQQRRIAGGIRRAVAADAGHPQMDGFDFGDQPLRLGGRAEGGDRHELAGTAQAANHIFAEVGVIPHPGQRQRVR